MKIKLMIACIVLALSGTVSAHASCKVNVYDQDGLLIDVVYFSTNKACVAFSTDANRMGWITSISYK